MEWIHTESLICSQEKWQKMKVLCVNAGHSESIVKQPAWLCPNITPTNCGCNGTQRSRFGTHLSFGVMVPYKFGATGKKQQIPNARSLFIYVEETVVQGSQYSAASCSVLSSKQNALLHRSYIYVGLIKNWRYSVTISCTTKKHQLWYKINGLIIKPVCSHM